MLFIIIIKCIKIFILAYFYYYSNLPKHTFGRNFECLGTFEKSRKTRRNLIPFRCLCAFRLEIQRKK